MSTALVAKQVQVAFGGVQALKGVDVEVRPGQIAGLIGRNGSGKTTLFNCMTGFVQPDAGRVIVDGAELTGLSPDRVVKYGVARTFQTPRVDPASTVIEAVLCGFYATTRSTFLTSLLGLPSAWREERILLDRAGQILEQLGLAKWRTVNVGKLSMALIRLVEVARALASGAKYVLLDEPAAGLTTSEQERLAQQIRQVAKNNVGILLVDHNMHLIRSVCDAATVLDMGRVVCSGSPEEVMRDERVVRSYLGAIGGLSQTVEAAE